MEWACKPGIFARHERIKVLFFPDQIDSSVPINIMRLFNNSVRWLREGYYDIRINSLYVGDMKHFYTQFKPGRQEGNIVYTLPDTQADGAKYLFNDGNGNLSWQPLAFEAGDAAAVYNFTLLANQSTATNNWADLTDSEIEIEAAGWYICTMHDNHNAGEAVCQVLKNGTSVIVTSNVFPSDPIVNTVVRQGVVYLDIGDTVKMQHARKSTDGGVYWTQAGSGYSLVQLTPLQSLSVWGTITGTLSDQVDLQNALNAKEPTIASGTTAQYWRGDKTWQTLNHATLPNLGFDDSGHTGFQKELVYDDILGCYLIG